MRPHSNLRIVDQGCEEVRRIITRVQYYTNSTFLPEIMYYILVELIIFIPKKQKKIEICQLDDVIGNYVTKMHKL